MARLITAGEWVQTQRTLRGWTQEELAARWGRKAPALSRYESGKRQLKVEALLELCEIFGITPEAMMAALKLTR